MSFFISALRMLLVLIAGAAVSGDPLGTKSETFLSFITMGVLASFFILSRILDTVREILQRMPVKH